MPKRGRPPSHQQRRWRRTCSAKTQSAGKGWSVASGQKPAIGVGSSRGADRSTRFLIPIELKRRGVEAKLVMQARSGSPTPRDAKLVSLLADAQRWIDDLGQGRAVSLRHLARQYKRNVGEVSRTLPIAFLAPDIVAAILHGRQAIELTPRQLLRIGTMPHRWADQRRRLGCQYS